MRWRLSKLNWPYAVGELIIVTAGVLIALAINQWNSDRLDRAEELEIVEQLISDLQGDLQDLGNQVSALDEKEASLLRVRSILAAENSRPDDPAGFLRDVIDGANYGWNQMEAHRTTFDELLGSGKFSLIRDAGLRVEIAKYYDRDKDTHQRIDERETDFPQLSYRLVPRQDEGRNEAGDPGLVQNLGPAIESGLGDSDIEQLVAGVFASPIRDYINAEINLARFTRNRGSMLQSACLDLVGQLERYRDAIR